MEDQCKHMCVCVCMQARMQHIVGHYASTTFLSFEESAVAVTLLMLLQGLRYHVTRQFVTQI